LTRVQLEIFPFQDFDITFMKVMSKSWNGKISS